MPLANPASNQAAMAALDKYLDAISTSLLTVSRKEAGIRDAFDDVARANMEFLRSPHLHNAMTKQALELYAKQLVATEDYRQAKIAKIENNLVPLFMKLSADCKQAKTMRMRTFSGSEQSRTPSSGNVNEHSLNKQSGSLDALAQQSKTESELVNFERTKLQQLKKALSDAIMLELTFHSRAIEQLTPILKAMHEIDVESDLQQYCKEVLNIASGGPAAIRSESAASSQPRSQPSPSPTPANLPLPRKTTAGVPPVPAVPAKMGSNTSPAIQVSSSFDDGEEEEEFEGEEFETTDASTGGAGNWVPPGRGSAARQPGRPLTGAQGPPVPDRGATTAQQQQQPAQKAFNASLFLGSSGGK